MIDEQKFDGKLATIKKCFRALMDGSVDAPEAMLAHQAIALNTSGIYAFSERTASTECFLYVGQSVAMVERLREHCGFTDWNKANFAYKLTVETTGLKPIKYSPNATKQSMFEIPEFKESFGTSLCRIKTMNYRWVSVDNKLERNLLEIYAAVILGSRFNEFD